MSNYVKSTNFATKDTLPSGDVNKIVKGTEIDTEFNNIATAVSTKADTAAPTFTGTTTLATATITTANITTANITTSNITGGSITGITDLAVADGGTGSSTASGARSNLGAASSGSNSDITSLSGLSTPLSVAQGGTGSASTTYCNLTTNVTGTLPVANGGTGAASLTANNVLLGNGTSAVQVVAPGANGNILTSNGSTWTSAAPAAGSYVSNDVSNGVGSFNVGTDTGSTISNLGTTASFRGAILRGGSASFSSASLAGTWRNVSGNTIDGTSSEFGVFQRIS